MRNKAILFALAMFLSLIGRGESTCRKFKVQGILKDNSGMPIMQKDVLLGWNGGQKLIRTDSRGFFETSLAIDIPCMSWRGGWGSDKMLENLRGANDSFIHFYYQGYVGKAESGWWKHWNTSWSRSRDSSSHQTEVVSAHLRTQLVTAPTPMQVWEGQIARVRKEVGAICGRASGDIRPGFYLGMLTGAFEWRNRSVTEIDSLLKSFRCDGFAQVIRGYSPDEYILMSPADGESRIYLMTDRNRMVVNARVGENYCL